MVSMNGLGSSVPRSTSTMSTIAIKAGDHTRIVLAAIKSEGWVQLRIDEMQPALLEFGSHLDESEHLLALHQDLMARLQAKQENIQDLLTQADSLVTEQQACDVPVYEAMARSMASTWKDLNKQLQIRSIMLETSHSFFTNVEKHEQIRRKMEREIRIGSEYTANPELLQRWLKDMESMRKELIEATATAMDYGVKLITHIRELGDLDDNPGRPRETLEQCQKVESVMLTLGEQWKRMEAVWEESSAQWKTGVVAAQWRTQLDKVDHWLHENEQFVMKLDLGDSSYSAERCLRQIEALVTEATDQQDILHRAEHGIEQVTGQDKASLQSRCRDLTQRVNQVVTQANSRKPLFADAVQFFRNADVAVTGLHALQGEVHGADAGRVGQYSGKAKQAGGAAVQQGNTLLQMARGNSLGAQGVSHKINEIEDLMKNIESTCTSKGRELTDAFEREYRVVSSWLTDTAQPFLRSNVHMGESYNEVQSFIERYRSFQEEVLRREAEVYQLLNRLRGIDAPQLLSQTQSLQAQFKQIKEIVEHRLRVSSTYSNSFKYIDQSKASADSMSSVLTTSTAGDTRTEHELQELWTGLERSINSLKEQNTRFTTEMHSSGGVDRDLQVQPCQTRLHNAEREAEERRRQLAERWKQWREAQSQLANINSMVQQIEYWIQEVTEVVVDTERRTEQSRTSEEVSRLLRGLDPYDRQSTNIDSKLRQAEVHASQLNVEETDHHVQQTRKKYKVIVDRLVEMKHHLTTLVQTFTQREIQEAMKPPKFTQPLRDGQVKEGKMFEFTCQVTAEPEPTVTWYKDGMTIGGAVDYKTSYRNGLCILRIDQAFVEDASVFSCRAQNEAGVAETRARLIVDSVPKGHAPVVTPSLVNQNVTEGHRIAFECKVTAEPAADVRWYHNDQQVFSGGEVQLSTERNGWHKLVVTKASTVHHGIYKIEATNVHGSDRSQASLNVQQQQKVVAEEAYESHTGFLRSATAPEFVRPFSAEYQLKIGQKSRIECVLVGNPRPKITWVFNGRTLLPGNELCSFTNYNDTYCIMIDRVGREHQGTWELRAENIRGQAECITRIVVGEAVDESAQWAMHQQKARSPMPAGTPPHFSQTLVSMVSSIGEQVKFEGIVSGAPPPEITWLKDGQPFNPTAQPNVRFTNLNGHITLSFEKATVADSGKYTCTAKNQAGVATSSAQMVVQSKSQAPDFLQRLISRELAEGETLKWSVKVTGDPMPTVRWLRNGETIPNCPEVQLVQEGPGSFGMHILKIERADAGQFTALAENVAGEARSTADLVVRPAGSAPNPYYHVTKVTQAKQMQGQEVSRNESCTVENPSPIPFGISSSPAPFRR